MTSAWRRVTRNDPCPVCAKPDWCGVSGDGAMVHCMRSESDRPCSGGGWLHRTGEALMCPAPVERPLPLTTRRDDLDRLARQWIGNLTDERLEPFADMLGVDAAALVMLGIGWTGRAWSFPMHNAERLIVGIRLRAPTGAKFAVRGGKEGVFVPCVASDGPLLFPEGPTDAAALLGLGFDVVGRPSCQGAVRFCVALARGRDAVVVADDDEPGRRGAEVLAVALLPVAASVRVIVPPAKDAREWVKAGASRHDVLDLIDRTQVRRLRMREDGR